MNLTLSSLSAFATFSISSAPILPRSATTLFNTPGTPEKSKTAIIRIAGTKDFGDVFPGHGGILDRFDSYLFAVPFTLLFVEFGARFIF